METLAITPLTHPPQKTTVRVPGSKSLTNRALLVAALAEGQTCLSNALFSDDSYYFASALQQLGFKVELDTAQQHMTVYGLGGDIPAQHANLYIGNAGTAARFLTAMLTLGYGEYTVDGDARMRQRPIGDLVSALNALGGMVRPIDVRSLDDPSEAVGLGQVKHPKGRVCPPIQVLARGLPGGKASVAGSTSSQYLSGLLLVAPYARGPVELIVQQGLNSKPYVDMTISVMVDFGVRIERQDYEWFRIQPQRYQAQAKYDIESDASAASYFFAVPAICGGSVTVEQISRRSRQGDIAFLDVLALMGCTVQESSDGISVQGTSELHGVDVDLRDIPDTAQTLAVIAPFASTPTTIRGIASARVKESDRVSATCSELTHLGVMVEEHPDGMTIYPCRSFTPATIQTYNDHRMAMAFALIGLRAPGLTIANPSCVSKTFPDYFQVLESLHEQED